jgi:hypothetical protein
MCEASPAIARGSLTLFPPSFAPRLSIIGL